MTGRFSGVGRVAGRKLAYVRWADGRVEEFTLSEFRRRFGVSALSLETGAAVVGTLQDGPIEEDPMSLPFVIVRAGHDDIPLFAGLDNGSLVGITAPDGEVFEFEPEDVVAAVNIEPAAVYWGLALEMRAERRQEAAEARRGRRRIPRALGHLFVPELPATGFPENTLVHHRTEIPSQDTVMLSALFAVSTVRTPIEDAEKSFNCFIDLYQKRGRRLPDASELFDCFRGLQRTKARVFHETAEYAPVIHDALARGLMDRDLRRYLLRETTLPAGLGAAKMSFTLALLGHDCVCLDGRLLGRMFGAEKVERVSKGWEKFGSHVTELGLKRYEQVENSFLAQNPFYNPSDPIGRARAQWMAWESVGGKAAAHSVWLNVVTG